jgi:hypothetical protein
MVLQFIKRDPAWKLTPGFTAVAAVAAAIHAFQHQSWLPMMLIFPIYIVLFTRVMPHQRVTFFEAALPVSGRDLFQARCLALLGMIWLPALAATAMLLLAGGGGHDIADIAIVALVLTLSVLVTLSVRIREFAAPSWLAMCSPVIAALTIPLLTLGQPLLVAGICAAAVVVVGGLAWSAVPEGFQCGSPDARVQRRTRGKAAPAIPWWPVIRSLLPWQTAIFIPISLIWSTTGEWIFAPMYLMMSYNQTRISTRWTFALPVRRRVLLAASVLPLLLVLAGGAEIGMLTGKAQPSRDLIRLGDSEHFRTSDGIDVWVNRAFWRYAPGGLIPVVQAPWGETTQPEAQRVAGLTFYNPYSVGQQNSPQFQDWQWARATERIYGRPVAGRDLKKAVDAGLRPVTLSPRMQVLSVLFIVASALMWAWAIEMFSWQGWTRVSTAVRNTFTYSIVMVPVGLLLADIVLASGPGTVSRSLLIGGLLRLSETLPDNLALVAMLGLVPLAGMWWMLERQAAVAEIPAQPARTGGIFDRS